MHLLVLLCTLKYRGTLLIAWGISYNMLRISPTLDLQLTLVRPIPYNILHELLQSFRSTFLALEKWEWVKWSRLWMLSQLYEKPFSYCSLHIISSLITKRKTCHQGVFFLTTMTITRSGNTLFSYRIWLIHYGLSGRDSFQPWVFDILTLLYSMALRISSKSSGCKHACDKLLDSFVYKVSETHDQRCGCHLLDSVCWVCAWSHKIYQEQHFSTCESIPRPEHVNENKTIKLRENN